MISLLLEDLLADRFREKNDAKVIITGVLTQLHSLLLGRHSPFCRVHARSFPTLDCETPPKIRAPLRGFHTAPRGTVRRSRPTCPAPRRPDPIFSTVRHVAEQSDRHPTAHVRG